jgi:hypothetical protein
MKMSAIFWLLIVLASVFALHMLDNHVARDHMGRAIACSDKFPFKNTQAEILEYGLQDVSGLAWDQEKTRVFLAERSRSLLIYWLDAGMSPDTKPSLFEDPEPSTMCSDESCGIADQRGLAIMDGKLFTAEHGRGQIAVRDLPPSHFQKDDGAKWLLSASPLPVKQELLTEPSGIAAVDHRLFVTDEPRRSVPAPKANSTASVEPVGDDRATAQASGALYVCTAIDCATITTSLRHPSGVAAEKANGPVFVADSDGHEVRWPVYENAEGKWREVRSLGSVAISEKSIPSFLGLALDDYRQLVFAAGPGGLYVFDFSGTLLGRIMFDDPVTGVAMGKDQVYLAVGHTLCALTFDDAFLSHPNTIKLSDVTPAAGNR